jgi:hypothetical protein
MFSLGGFRLSIDWIVIGNVFAVRETAANWESRSFGSLSGVIILGARNSVSILLLNSTLPLASASLTSPSLKYPSGTKNLVSDSLRSSSSSWL